MTNCGYMNVNEHRGNMSMSDTEEIKVIIYSPAYNHESYIRDTLDGFVMQQTSFRFQAIVHDDASTDKTADIIREYEAKYPDIIHGIYQTENKYSKGASIRTIVMDSAPYGKYVAMCEGDDYWTDPLKLQMQYDFMENHPDYSMCAHEVTKMNMRTRENSTYTFGMKEGDINLVDLCKNIYGFPHTSSCFIRKEFFIMPDWIPRGLTGDRPMTLYCAVNGKIYFTERVMSVYRRYSGEDSWNERKDRDRALISKMHQNYITVGEVLDKHTGYVHSDAFFYWIIENKYALAINQGKMRLIFYDSYKGTKRRYNWIMTFSTFAPLRLAFRCIPVPTQRVLVKLLWGSK